MLDSPRRSGGSDGGVLFASSFVSFEAREVVGAAGFEPAAPCAQGKLERPCEVLLLERFAASKNSWAQFWAHPCGEALLLTARSGKKRSSVGDV